MFHLNITQKPDSYYKLHTVNRNKFQYKFLFRKFLQVDTITQIYTITRCVYEGSPPTGGERSVRLSLCQAERGFSS